MTPRGGVCVMRYKPPLLTHRHLTPILATFVSTALLVTASLRRWTQPQLTKGGFPGPQAKLCPACFTLSPTKVCNQPQLRVISPLPHPPNTDGSHVGQTQSCIICYRLWGAIDWGIFSDSSVCARVSLHTTLTRHRWITSKKRIVLFHWQPMHQTKVRLSVSHCTEIFPL